MKTTLIITSIALILLVIIRWLYIALRSSSCCGTCGCNTLTDKQKKSMLAKRAKKAKKELEVSKSPSTR